MASSRGPLLRNASTGIGEPAHFSDFKLQLRMQDSYFPSFSTVRLRVRLYLLAIKLARLLAQYY